MIKVRLFKYTVIALTVYLVLRLLPITYNINIPDFDRQDWKYNMYFKSVMFILDNVVDFTDTVVFHIDSYGGDVSMAFALYDSIENTPAKTVANIKSGAYSAGAFLALMCDEITASKYSVIMFHKAQARNGFMGKLVPVDNFMIDSLIADRLNKYLAPEEIEWIQSGMDLKMPGKLFAYRFNGAIPPKYYVSVVEPMYQEGAK